MKSILTVIKEQVESFYLIRRLSLFELKSDNNNNYLGILWELINPLIQISIYWFVFGYGIRSGEAVDGIPYIMWLLAGISVWFFFYQATLHGSKSIYTRIKLISKMNFPMSVIPSYVIVSKFYPHIMLLGVVVILFQFMGFPISIYFIQLPYYLFATLALVFSVSLITSTLSTIVRDVQMVVQSILRVMIYLTPFLWTANKLPEFIQNIMKLNPLYYIVEGYRSALLGTSWYFIEEIQYTLYFWAVILVLLLFGSILHVKFRNHFVDYI
jgi:teichoic acid transport system permease protein